MNIRGRPRQFDREQALRSAMRLFRHHGYDGTPVAVLAQEMGITASSLYAAFGSKEALYREVVDFYVNTVSVPAISALAKSRNARRGIEAFLKTCAAQFTAAPDGERGCMIASGDMVYAPENQALAEGMTMRRSLAEQSIRERLEKARAGHELPRNVDVKALAAYFAVVVQGMSVRARDGASVGDLNKIIKMAMRVWPEAGPVEPD